uniref:R2R3-MYB transcription factor MYB8 n=1 Tax=Epimedium sagittatum TaxID=253616 RepID=H9XUF8_9MAGN|nr:R2R3-MYB transcription factor MYB8 [Epimedium sagittatum]
MEIQSPRTYHSNTNWLLEQSKTAKWTHEENKLFETALAICDKETPDRWQKVAEMIPGKTVSDVIKQYKELEDDVSDIEAGLVPIPGYTTSFTLDWMNNQTFGQSFDANGKRSSSGRPTEQERKKGVPWTEDEHKLFLMGLKKYGKGDWRNISRNFVITRTPTQVASHAQKYFIRQLSGGKDKRRSSIHDITTVNLNDTRPPSPDSSRSSLEQSAMLQQSSNHSSTNKPMFGWNQPHDGTPTMVFNHTNMNMFVPPYGANSYGTKMQGQNLHRGGFHGSHIGPHGTVFQMQSSQCHPHG